MSAVVEKTFVWKFMDQISQGVANARQAMDEAVRAASSMGSKVSESGEQWHNYASKQKEAMDEAKANFNEYKDQVSNSSNSIREKISSLIDHLQEIPHDVVTTLKSKINDENIGLFSRKVRDVPKERSVLLRAKDKFSDIFKHLGERIKQIPKEYSLLLKVKDGFSKGFQKFNESAKKTRENGHRLRDIIEGTFIGNALYGAYDKVKDGIVAATGAGLKFDAEQQKMIATWTTLTGSAGKAKDMVQSINDLAVKTGQSVQIVDELEQGFYHLHSSKKEADDLTHAMLNMGDAVGLTGDQLMSVSQDMVHSLAQGKLTAGALNQLGMYFPMVEEKMAKFEEAHAKASGSAVANTKAVAQAQRDYVKEQTLSFEKIHYGSTITNSDLKQLAQQNIISAGEAQKFQGMLSNGQKVNSSMIKQAIKVNSSYVTAAKNGSKQVGSSADEAVANLRQMVQKGQVSAKDVEDIFKQMGLHDYAAAAENLMKTFDGMERVLKARSQALMGIVMAPVLKAANPIMEALTHWVNDPKTESLMNELGKKIQKGMTTVTKAFAGKNFTSKGLNDALNQMVENAGKSVDKLSAWLTKNAGNIKEFGSIVKSSLTIAFKVMGAAINDVVTVLGFLVNPLGKVSDHSKDASNSVGGLAGALKSLASNGPALKSFGAILATLFVAKKVTSMINGLRDINETLHLTAAAGKLVSLAFSPWVLIPAIIIAIGAVLYELYKHNEKFRDFVNGIAKSVDQFIKPIAKTITSVFDVITGKMDSAKRASGNMFLSKIFPESVIQKINIFGDNLRKWSGDAADKFNKFGRIVKDVFNIFTTSMSSAEKWKASADLSKLLPPKVVAQINKAAASIGDGFKTMGKVISKVWKEIQPIVKLGMSVITKTIELALKLLLISWRLTWTAFSTAISLAWKIIEPIVKLGMLYLKSTIIADMDVIAAIWKATWNVVIAVVKATWNVIKPLIIGAMNVISDVIQTVMDIIDGRWDKVWNDIKHIFSDIWKGISQATKAYMNGMHDVISSILDAIVTIWNGAWQGLGDFFKNIWKGIKQAAQDGINGVLSVINAGVDGIDSIWKFFTGHKTSVHHLEPVKFAQGGVVHTRLSMVNDGAGQNWKELLQLPSGELKMTHQRNAVLPLPVGTRVYNGDETASIMASAGVDHYAHGGIVGDAINWTKGKLSDIGSWIGDKAEAVEKFLKDPLGNISKLLHKATDGLFKGADSFGDLASGTIGKLSHIAVDKFKEMLNSTKKTLEVSDGKAGHYNPSLIEKAAKIMHVWPLPAGFSENLQSVIMNESGGKSVIQSIHDMNSGGNEAGGILQYTPGTFAAYAMPGHTNRMNPLDELLAFFNNSDWRNSIGHTVIWGVPKMEWLHSGPQGSRRFAHGGEVFDEQSAIVGDNSQHHEFVINPYDVTAYPLLAKAMDTTMRAQPISSQDNNSRGNDNGETNALLRQANALLQIIADKKPELLDDLAAKLRQKDAQTFRMQNS
ncbi:tape measure protein [Lactiplantibacillus plantarum]|uniref:tape measure protein n=1 Tax=Lactiplantibacillus plantarum TaxID=1590 RepID=UPI003C285838